MNTPQPANRPVEIAHLDSLEDRKPAYALVAGVDLVVVRYSDESDPSNDRVSVLYGRCHHRGALLADGHVEGSNLICGVHNWDYRVDTGVSEYNNAEALHKFTAWIEGGAVMVDEDEVVAFAKANPQPYRRDDYLGLYQDTHGGPEEPENGYIQQLARDGLKKLGHHGAMVAMGVPRTELPKWTSIQLLTAQLAQRPLGDDATVATELVIGPMAKRPLTLSMPLFVSDMSFGALSEEAKVALASGAELAGTAICSGEGGMLAEEQAACSRYLYELASAKFGWRPELVERVQAFHFKGARAPRRVRVAICPVQR